MHSAHSAGRSEAFAPISKFEIGAPLFDPSAWSDFVGHIWQAEPGRATDDCRFLNAGTCPDCGFGMVRLGTCMSCPSCGYGSCGE
ncbi:MAG: hypothetical protein NDJ18_08635 [candidate division Zixibacteria bacterium]|nr:hypothetical protein [candidate division Zixibacteria bacterium]